MNRLSWNEIRVQAANFAEEWKGARYERGETQSFYNDLFEVFGVKRRRVASFEEPVKKLGNKQGFIDLFWKGVLRSSPECPAACGGDEWAGGGNRLDVCFLLGSSGSGRWLNATEHFLSWSLMPHRLRWGSLLVEQKSAGRSLQNARQQALDYFPGLKEHELPRYVLLCDFQNFELHDLDEGTQLAFPLAELPKHVEAFGFILGIQKRTFRDQDPANIAASEIMGRLHDALEAAGYTGHDLERLLVRLLFCLFADDTGIFEPRGMFETLIEERTQEDGRDLGRWLSELFDVLNEPENARQASLDADLGAFPYINGDLFAERLRVPAFSAEMRKRLLEACAFNWEKISPAIFGALFQSVMHRDERRSQGAHYTTERNILKVIKPLFLDELRQELSRLAARRDTGRRAALEAFHERLTKLRFFDPACGCGNFLVIAYRELRELEMDVLRALYSGASRVLDVASLVRVNVDQFYGIEIGEFPARIAEVALWMTDHIANNRVSLEFGQVFARIPLRTRPHIHHGDALETDWSTLLAPGECDYVFGNPPFIGAKYQSAQQRTQVQRVAHLGGSGGTLDYVSAWFLKAGDYVRSTPEKRARIGFVSTNSITQGEQVAQLWPLLFNRCGLELAFAHRTFAWGSDARGVAHVHVVIIGLRLREDEPATKPLFTYPDINGDPIESPHAKLSPYLTDASRLADPHIVVRKVTQPINGAPQLVIGSKPIDGGHLILDAAERDELLAAEPAAAPYVRPYVGSEELINGGERWILALQAAPPGDLRRMARVTQRLQRVREFRQKSSSAPTNVLAATPTLYHVTVIPEQPFLAIPEVSSERREYVPLAYLQPPTVPSNLVRVLQNSDVWQFGVLTSKMHMAWLREIGGRLKSDVRYSIGIVYNTFPWPAASTIQQAQIRVRAQAVLDARAASTSATLADLYDPLTMPPALRQAHRQLDAAVERLYRPQAFGDDTERVEHLLKLYETLASPLLAAGRKPVRRRATPSTRARRE